MTKNTDFMELGKKSHETTANNNNNKPRGGRDSHFHSTYIVLFKMSNFQQKVMIHAKKL